MDGNAANERPEYEHLLTYGEYLEVPQLLSLQHPRSQPEAHDELQFIIVHQVYELWFKLMLHELDEAARHVTVGTASAVREACHVMKRVHAIQRVLLQQLHVLETMRPMDFLRFRGPLKPASGFQSIQFRELEFFLGLRDERLLKLTFADEDAAERLRKRIEGPSFSSVLLEHLRSLSFRIAADDVVLAGGDEALPSIQEIARLYADYDRFPEAYELAESCVELDEFLLLWRRHHVMMVERQIGERPGTGAPVNQGLEGSRYLLSTLTKRAFPYLWIARSYLPEP
ncbi:MAG: tryptophan 2,3-dioxygenase [Planctomycetes bacterium]|nr:tryptophan 2,3-dioxygenase [Planctomycetota bacterium]